jgi:hypothetical protein
MAVMMIGQNAQLGVSSRGSVIGAAGDDGLSPFTLLIEVHLRD